MPVPGTLPPGPRYVDPTASATGELIYEMAIANGWPVTLPVARALYVALVTDTGGFRFSNTHPRTLRIAADLLETGIDPESIYLDVYAGAPEGRPRLLADTLQTLVVEPDVGTGLGDGSPGRHRALWLTPDDLDGIVEHPRSIEGVKLALLFREMSQGRVKVSLRSVGKWTWRNSRTASAGEATRGRRGWRCTARCPRCRKRSSRRRGVFLRGRSGVAAYDPIRR